MTDPRKPIFDAAKAAGAKFVTQTDVKVLNDTLDRLGTRSEPEPAKPGKKTLANPADANPTSVPHFAVMAEHLENEEGRVRHAYQDHLGYWTIGIGRLIDKRKGGRLTDAEIDFLLANDIREKIEAIEDWPAWQAVKDDPYRATALLSMAFQMGVEGLAGFKNSLRLVADRQWAAAASNMMESLWARQTPARAKRVTQMIATGRPA